MSEVNLTHWAAQWAGVNWFSQVGTYPGGAGRQAIQSLLAWDAEHVGAQVDARHAEIAVHMDWLPTGYDQDDPFLGGLLTQKLKGAGSTNQTQVMDACKQAMRALRQLDASGLVSGPHDYSQAARGAALYAVRMAAIETVLSMPGIWSQLLSLYLMGYWPCGRLPNGDVVVY